MRQLTAALRHFGVSSGHYPPATNVRCTPRKWTSSDKGWDRCFAP